MTNIVKTATKIQTRRFQMNDVKIVKAIKFIKKEINKMIKTCFIYNGVCADVCDIRCLVCRQ